MNEILVEYFKHNLWANLRLLDACERLTDAQLDASVPGTYGTIRNTLVHLFGAEQRYVTRLSGEQPEEPVRESEGFHSREVLRRSAVRSGEALVALAGRAEPGQVLHVTYHGQPQTLPGFIPFLQAINHATEHRSHISTVLSQQGLEGLAVDAWDYTETLAGE